MMPQRQLWLHPPCFPFALRLYSFPRNSDFFREESLLLRRLSGNASFFLNLRNHTFSTSRSSLAPDLSRCCPAPPELGDRPRSQSRSARSSFAFFLPPSRVYGLLVERYDLVSSSKLICYALRKTRSSPGGRIRLNFLLVVRSTLRGVHQNRSHAQQSPRERITEGTLVSRDRDSAHSVLGLQPDDHAVRCASP